MKVNAETNVGERRGSYEEQSAAQEPTTSLSCSWRLVAIHLRLDNGQWLDILPTVEYVS